MPKTNLSRLVGATIASTIGLSAPTSAQTVTLQDDFTRAELEAYANAVYEEFRAFPLLFKFPEDTTEDRAYGIDVSHHQDAINWNRVASSGVDFVYMKASQGATFVDPRFKANWESVGELSNQGSVIYRGAYHFFSASTSPEDQARNFLAQIGELHSDDLAPCLDVEWDFRRQNGKAVVGPDGRPLDHWSRLSPEDIVERISVWLGMVEAETGKTPIIYTNGYWWDERIGSAGVELAKHVIWIADYSARSRGLEDPRFVPDGFSWAIWQISDRGVADGVGGGVDTNLSQETFEELIALLGAE